MKELTLIIDNWTYPELEEYLLTVNGVISSKVNVEDDEIYIKYDSEKTSIEILIMEISLFLDIKNTPTIIGFNKHSNSTLEDYTLNIKDICCEYCLKSDIEELLLKEGIESINTDYDYHNAFNVNLFIKYNPYILDKSKLEEIEKEINMS